MSETIVDRVVPNPPPDGNRGSLERAVKALRKQPELNVRTNHGSLALWHRPGAANFSSDPILRNPLMLLEELNANGVSAELVARLVERRWMRRKSNAGRRRDGEPALLYLVYVDGPGTSVMDFHRQLTPDVLKACHYTRYPSLSTVESDFEALEQDAGAFREVKNLLTRAAVASEPRVGEIGWFDGTLSQSGAALRDACPNPRQCARLRRKDGPLKRGADSQIQEAHEREVADGSFGEAPTRKPLTRRPYLDVVKGAGPVKQTYGIYDVGGHVQRSLDWEMGVRWYSEERIFCFGAYQLSASSMFLDGAPVDIHYQPADVNEFDGLHELHRRWYESFGAWPLAWSGDKALFVRSCFELLTRRGTALITPTNARERERAAWRTDLYDEDGELRCLGCGRARNSLARGYGLRLIAGEPHIRGRCFDWSTDRCEAPDPVSCALEWRLLGPLSRLSEVYHAIKERHRTLEHEFRHGRQRHGLAGKHHPQLIGRRGLGARELRAQASLLLLWSRLCLRNGWLTPILIPCAINDADTVRLSGRQDRETLELLRPGVGSSRLRALHSRRVANGLNTSYGRGLENLRATVAEALQLGDGTESGP
jgi:hypothetical protein